MPSSSLFPLSCHFSFPPHHFSPISHGEAEAGGGEEKSLFFRRGQHSQACTIPHPINRAHTHVQPKHKRSDRYSYCGKHNFHIWTASCQRDETVTDIEAPDWQRLGWFTLTLVHALLLRSPSSLSFIISSNSALEPGLWFMLRIWLAHVDRFRSTVNSHYFHSERHPSRPELFLPSLTNFLFFFETRTAARH